MGLTGPGPDRERSEPTVLVVDDEAATRSACVGVLEPRMSVTAHASTDNVAVDRSRFDALVLGLATGSDAVAGWLAAARAASIPVVAIADAGDPVGSTVRALRSGAHSAIAPITDGAELIAAVLDAIATVASPAGPDLGMVGASPAIRAVRTAVRRASQATGVPVLIQGESGTGKELVAQALHRMAAPGDPFVAVNCAALTETLLEAELFGYEPGAFTGASADGRAGLFRAAGGGVLLLDEIGEMAASLQAKLLRVLQERAVRPVGSEADEEVSCRVVASTNRRLGEAVERGEFRRDLFFRLNVFTIEVPALRERSEDIGPLAWHFLRDAAARFDRATPRFSRDALDLLGAHAWPGNIRELRNVVEQALFGATGPEITAVDLGLAVTARSKGGRQLPLASCRLRDAEAALIELVIRETGGNVSQAARRLGINRSTLYAKLREFGIARVDSV